MDPALSQVLLGLMTNAMGTVVERSWATATGFDMDLAVEEAGLDFDYVEKLSGEIGAESLRQFLLRPEVVSCIKMLFAVEIQGDGLTSDRLRERFCALFMAAQLGDGPLGERLYSELTAGVSKLVADAASEGDDTAIRSLENVRFRHLSEELGGLRKSLEGLIEFDSDRIATYLDWEQRYLSQVLARHGTITPPSFDAVERVPIDEIYVDCDFLIGGEGNVERTVSRVELVEGMHRMVVLGDPGAGKSTFVAKLAVDLAGRSALLGGTSPSPLVVTLKDYGAAREKDRIPLLEWMEEAMAADYSAPVPSGCLEYLLEAGRMVVILDGLDELLDSSYRREITDVIEAFAARYPIAPILVTSRRVGYMQAPLDPRRFDIARLSELDEDQILTYAKLWFGLRHELTQTEKVTMAEEFFRDSENAAADLRSNALMLALLCNIFRGAGYIPQHRPQVYEKCAVMLFERWDRGRRIEVAFEFDRHLRPAMQHLAFWVYSESSLRGGVTEHRLIQRTTDYLLGRRFDDEDSARQEARRFIEFCRGRAWVFSDTGTTRDGESLFQFTHRTFLEYFAAEYLVRTNPTPDDLATVIAPRIRLQEWDVVNELAVQLQDDNVEGAADKLLKTILGHARERGVVYDSSLEFSARTLTYLVPRRSTCREVARVVTNRALEWMADPAVQVDQKTAAEAFGVLVNCDYENADPVIDAVMSVVKDRLAGGAGKKEVEAGLEIAASADIALRNHSRDAHEVREKWERAQFEAFQEIWPAVEARADESRVLAYDAWFYGRWSLARAVDSHGIAFLLESRGYQLYGNRVRTPPFEACLLGQLGDYQQPDGTPLGAPAELAMLGGLFLDATPPWDRSGRIHTGQEAAFEDLVVLDPVLDGDALFGCFMALALVIEQIGEEEVSWICGELHDAVGWPQMLAPLVESRFHGDQGSVIPPALPLNDRQLICAQNWATGKWSAVGAGTTSREGRFVERSGSRI